MNSNEIFSKSDILIHWQGHRSLTRKTIAKFPESELFTFSIGGMRTFADLVKELLSIGEPGLRSIVSQVPATYNHDLPLHTKAALLDAWDADTAAIDQLYAQLDEARFQESFNLFGEYNFPIKDNILYFFDNEVHHRAQGFVYLRALGIEPPFFWDRN